MTRILRLLARLLPARVRSRHLDSLERTFAARVSDTRESGGRLAAWAVAGRDFADVCISAARDRLGGDPLRMTDPASRAAWPKRTLAALMGDVRFAWRLLVRQPTFTAASVLTLALGIGANVAVFSVVWNVMLAPSPLRNEDRLASVFMTSPTVTRGRFSALDWRDVADEANTIGGLATYHRTTRNLTGAGDPLRLTGYAVTPNFFATLGAAPAVGRLIAQADGAGPSTAVVLSHNLWRRQFGGDPGVAGREIQLNGEPLTIVGVMPRGAAIPDDAEFWVPLIWEADDFEANQRGARFLEVVGRLTPGTTIDQAQAEVAAIAGRLATEFDGTNADLSMSVIGLRDAQITGVRPSLIALAAGVALVLLIACSNLANLTLTRGLARSGEVAVRASLGASRARLVTQLLIEGLVLSAAGAAVAILLAVWGVRSILLLVPEGLPRLEQVEINLPVLAFMAALTVVTALVFSLAPAWQASRSEVAQLTRENGTRSVTSGHRLRRGLAVAEVAFAVMLVGTAGLLGRTLFELSRIDPGFQPEGVLTFNVTLPESTYPTASERQDLFQRMTDELGALPGIESAGVGYGVPFGRYNAFSSFNLPDLDWQGDDEPTANLRMVAGDYFDTLGIPTLSGRVFDERDGATGQLVAIISEATATRYFGDVDPIGRQLRVHVSMVSEAPRGPRTIVGVVGDVRVRSLTREPAPEIYMPYGQHSVASSTMVLETSGDPLAYAASVRARMRAIDPNLPVADVQSLDALVSNSTARERLTAVLLTVFAAIAVVLATVGLYGVFSVGVSQRSREIGIRMALGAGRSQVLGLFVREGLLLTLAGSALGVAGALAAATYVESLLVGVSPRDPLTLALAWLVLTLVSGAACYVPARRAAWLDPVSVLQE